MTNQTRLAATEALARWLWPNAKVGIVEESVCVLRQIAEKKADFWPNFCAFNDPYAARLIVEKMHKLLMHLDTCESAVAFKEALAPDCETSSDGFWAGILATPEQISLAACKALGIETE